MNHLSDAGSKGAVVCFFIFFVIFGAFFLMNLFVAVVFDEFNTAQRVEKRKVELMEARQKKEKLEQQQR